MPRLTEVVQIIIYLRIKGYGMTTTEMLTWSVVRPSHCGHVHFLVILQAQ